jgi:RES domain-containing protein
MLAPRWAFAPLSGEGAARAGGRWNERGQPALYLSADHATAIAEYQQQLPRPGALTAYDVDAVQVLDLTDRTTLAILGVDSGLFRLAWKHARDILKTRPVTWDLAAAAHAHGCHGLRVPSVQSPGVNLVLWRWNDGAGTRLEHADPLGDLPRDQRSWPSWEGR